MSLTKNAGASSATELMDRMHDLRARIGVRLRIGLHANSERIGLRRDLAVPHEPPAAKIPISVRPLQAADIPIVLPLDDSGDAAAHINVANRRAMANRHIAGGYVAVDERDGTPCYVQWLFGASDNDYVAGLGGFPRLGPDTALLENAFTPPAYRGLRIMPEAMARIAEHAADLGARYVLTFVGEDNIPSMKGCQRAGFFQHLVHRQDQYVFGLVRRHSFRVLDAEDPRRTRIH